MSTWHGTGTFVQTLTTAGVTGTLASVLATRGITRSTESERNRVQTRRRITDTVTAYRYTLSDQHERTPDDRSRREDGRVNCVEQLINSGMASTRQRRTLARDVLRDVRDLPAREREDIEARLVHLLDPGDIRYARRYLQSSGVIPDPYAPERTPPELHDPTTRTGTGLITVLTHPQAPSDAVAVHNRQLADALDALDSLADLVRRRT